MPKLEEIKAKDELLMREEEKLREKLLVKEKSVQDKAREKENKEKEKTVKVSKHKELEAVITKKQPQKEPEKINEVTENLEADIAKKQEEALGKEVVQALEQKFGLQESDLPAEFASLNASEKKLALQNLENIKYKLAKEGGLAKWQEEVANSKFAGMKWKDRVINLGVGKVNLNPAVLTKMWKGFSRDSKVKKYEKESLQQVEKGGGATYQNALSQISKGIEMVGLKSEVNEETKKLSILFADKEILKGKESLLQELNAAAQRFSKIPAEWGYFEDTLYNKQFNKEGLKNYQEFLSLKAGYDAVLKRVEIAKKDELAQEGADDKKIETGLLVMHRNIDSKVKFLQALNAHPDTIEALREIKSRVTDRTFLQKINIFKGFKTSIATGILTRGSIKYGATSFLGISATVVGPAVASIFGGYRAWKNAEQEIQDRQKLAREGKGAKSKELGTFVNLTDQKTKLEKAINMADPAYLAKVEEITQNALDKIIHSITTLGVDKEKRTFLSKEKEQLEQRLQSIRNGKYQKEMAERLRVRVNYVMQKMEAGLISGNGKEDIVERAELLSLIEEGAQYALAEDKNVKTAVENRLKSIMSVFEKGKRTERNWYKSQRILAGAILGGLISHEASEASHAVSGAVHHTELYQKMFGSHISDSEIHSPTEHSIKNIPHAPAVKVPESVHGFEVKFSSQGLGKTIETFKASSEFKNLPPEIQEAFKGSPMKVAEKLHGFLPKGNESVTVGPGSEFGVNEKGEIFLTDTHHPGEVHILGKLENGKIEVPEKTDLKYIHSKDAVSAEDKPSHAHVAGSGETEDDIPSHPNVAGSAETHDDIPSHARVAGSRLDIPNEDDAPSHAKVSGGTPKKAPEDMFSNENTTPNTTAHRGAPTEGTPNAVEKPSSSGIPANTEDIVQKTHGETKNVLYYIFSKNPDVDQAKVWTDLKEFKASAWFQTDYSDLSKAKTNTGIKIDLWAYMRALRLNTGIEVDGDETTEHYINRAGEAFVKENPSKTLDAIYELSQKYLDDVKRSQ